MDNFLNDLNLERFILVSGLRGLGKTRLFHQLYKYLNIKKNINSNRLLYLDLNRLKDVPNFNINQYLDVFINQINGDYQTDTSPLFIFIDEAQYANLDNISNIEKHENLFILFASSQKMEIDLDNLIVREIYPLSFREYLRFKNYCNISSNISNELINLIFTGDTDKINNLDDNVLDCSLDNYLEDYIQFSNLPFSFNKSKLEIQDLTLDIKDSIIQYDLDFIETFTSKTKSYAYPLVNIIAGEKPGDMSLEDMSVDLNLSKATVNNLMDALIRSNLIFDISSLNAKTNRKKKKIYFQSSQMKAAIYFNNPKSSTDLREYLKLFVENHIASLLFRLAQSNNNFNIYYDSFGDVDFLIKEGNDKNDDGNWDIDDKIIPIEIGLNKNNTKNIKKSIRRHKSDYGIIISNKHKKVIMEDKVIFIPLSIFSLI